LWALADLLFLRFLSRSSQLPRFHFTESRLTFSFVPNRDAWFSPPNVFPDFHFLGFSAARFFVRLGARSDPTARRAPVLSSRSILGKLGGLAPRFPVLAAPRSSDQRSVLTDRSSACCRVKDFLAGALLSSAADFPPRAQCSGCPALSFFLRSQSFESIFSSPLFCARS
jgi:hypothetical protein